MLNQDEEASLLVAPNAMLKMDLSDDSLCANQTLHLPTTLLMEVDGCHESRINRYDLNPPSEGILFKLRPFAVFC